MPQARKSTGTSSRRSATFKEPAALNRLRQSLDSAQKALRELSSHAGRDSAKRTRTLHKDLGNFVSSAKRDTGKFSTALKRDFQQAQKAVSRPAASRSRAGGKSTGSTTTRTATRRTTRKTS
jgi:hypothetical protein